MMTETQAYAWGLVAMLAALAVGQVAGFHPLEHRSRGRHRPRWHLATPGWNGAHRWTASHRWAAGHRRPQDYPRLAGLAAAAVMLRGPMVDLTTPEHRAQERRRLMDAIDRDWSAPPPRTQPYLTTIDGLSMLLSGASLAVQQPTPESRQRPTGARPCPAQRRTRIRAQRAAYGRKRGHR